MLLIFILVGISKLEAQYTVTVKNDAQVSANEYDFEVYIVSTGLDFNLTSYGLSLSYNSAIENSGTLNFSLIAGTSDLSIPPNSFQVVVDNGTPKLNCTSSAGSQTVSSTSLRIGKFKVTNTNTFGVASANLTWNFSGTFPTIININSSDATVQSNFSSSLSNPALPVQLASFTASTNNNAVNLTWKTATEVNNYGFEIQRSAVSGQQLATSQDGNWEKVGFVQGAGNSNSPKSYSFADNNLTGGTKFLYRLKQEDVDGSFEYSDTVEVTLAAQYTLYQNYPNPFNPTTTIKFDLPQAVRVSLIIYNILGQRVVTLVNNETMSAGVHSVPFNGMNLASGTYIYRLQTDKYVQIKKMILLK